MASADSFIIHDDNFASTDNDELDSLPSISSSVIDSEADSEAQAEWERSLEQMQLMLTMIIVPFVGKYFGRKFAFWSTIGPLHLFPSMILEDLRLTSILQVGVATWNGCTTSRLGGRTRPSSRPWEWQRRRQRCEQGGSYRFDDDSTLDAWSIVDRGAVYGHGSRVCKKSTNIGVGSFGRGNA